MYMDLALHRHRTTDGTLLIRPESRSHRADQLIPRHSEAVVEHLSHPGYLTRCKAVVVGYLIVHKVVGDLIISPIAEVSRQEGGEDGLQRGALARLEGSDLLTHHLIVSDPIVGGRVLDIVAVNALLSELQGTRLSLSLFLRKDMSQPCLLYTSPSPRDRG